MTDTFAKYLALIAVTKMRPVHVRRIFLNGKLMEVYLEKPRPVGDGDFIGSFLNMHRAKTWARRHRMRVTKVDSKRLVDQRIYPR